MAALIGKPPTHSAFLAVAGVISSGLIAVAVTEPLRRSAARLPSETRTAAWPLAALGAGSSLLGGVAMAADLVRDDAKLAAVVLIVAVGLAYLLPRWITGARTGDDALLSVLAAAFPFGALTTAAWLDHFTSASSTNAGYATGATGVVFDLLVLQLVRERFGDQIWRERTERPADLDRFTRDIWVELPSYGIPAVLALIGVWITAGPALGADRVATGTAPHIAALLIGLPVALGFAGVAVVAARLRSPDEIKPRLAFDPLSVGGVVLACATWTGLSVWALGNPLHVWAAAVVAALVVGFLVGENILSNAATLQLVRPGASGWIAAVGCAIAAASACFWLLTTGLRAGRGPATSASAGAATAVVLLGSAAIAILCGAATTLWTRVPRLTLNPGYTNVIQDQFLYAALALVIAVIPAFGVAHLQAADVRNGGIATVAALSVLPSLLFAYRWVIRNNRSHFESERERDISKVAHQRASTDSRATKGIESDRIAVLMAHGERQNRVSFWAIAAGYAWLLLTAVLK